MKAELSSLIEAGTAAVSDVFDALGLVPLVVDNSLVFMGGGSCRFAGPAYTIQGESFRWDGGGDRAKLEAIDLMPEGVVAVWAGGDIRGVCCFGDLLATAMKARGIAGSIVDGGIRDTAFHQEACPAGHGPLPHPSPGHRPMACNGPAGPDSSAWSSGRLDHDKARRHRRG